MAGMVEQDPTKAMVSETPIEVDVDETGRARAGSVNSNRQGGGAGGLSLGRTSTVESVRSSNSGGSGGNSTAEGPLSSILSNTKAFFRKRGSVSSAANSHPASAVEPPASSEQVSSRTEGSTEMEQSSSTRSPKPGNISLPKPAIQTGVPFDFGGATSNTASQNTGTTNSSAPRRIVSPSALGRGSSDESRMSVLSSGTTATDASTAPSSVSSPTAASSFPASTASLVGQGQPPNVQARMKTLPRLASYTVPTSSSSHAAEGSSSNTITSAGYDSSATMSGTDTEQEPSDTEDDDEEGDEDDDDDDDEHNEEDVRGGAAAMRTSLQRPALPTLASRSGGLNRLSSPGGAPARMTPFAMSPSGNPFQFQGWTTFASSTPTPGPLRTARPGPNDSAPNGSYFDARPISSSSNRAYGTPAQTPRPMSGDVSGTATPGGRLRSPMQPIATPGASPASRIRVDSRTASSSSPLRGYSGSQSPITTTSGQTFPASAIPPIPTTPGRPAQSESARPTFYQRQSRSLVNLSRSLEPDEPVNAGLSLPSPSRPVSSSGPGQSAGVAEPAPSTVASDIPTDPSPVFSSTVPANHNQQQPETIQVEQMQPRLRPRRQSMPEMRIDPPVYQIDDDFFVQYRKNMPLPIAREDEGIEALPAYSCDVHIEGWVPRKMEFLKPGVQSKDRRWKRQYVILHGTSIKVYRADPRVKTVHGDDAPPTPGIHKDNAKINFGSNAVGRSAAGSTASSASSSAAAARARAQTISSVSSSMSSASSAGTSGSMSSEKGVTMSRAATDTLNSRTFDPDIPVHVHAHDEEEHGLGSLQLAPSTLLAKAGENRCVRHYTLQGAESGLAADYLKRKHVVRVRAEGEQFLIQAKDDRAVIDWIEALQAATNTALDLDVRPLPKFITLPRRRRRRPRPEGTEAAAAAGATTAGAAASTAGRSTPPGSQGTAARSDAMNNMLAEEQESYLRQSGGGTVS